jgi:acyl-CoA reductase-like NAD-dependent aldehyde dehydrogenase
MLSDQGRRTSIASLDCRRVSLFTGQLYIDGEWVASDSGETFVSTDPANGNAFAVLDEGSRSDVDRAVAAARRAFPKFSSTPVWQRAELCDRVAETVARRREWLAGILSREQGKPFHTEALDEVGVVIDGYRRAAEYARHLHGETIAVADANKRVFTWRQPRGIYAVVTPWNFPMNVPTQYISTALAAGNTVVWVPAPTTSYCAVALVEILAEAGVPAGVVNLVTGEGAVVGDAAVSHEDVNGVGFTGSTGTGRIVATRAAGKPQLLELGGNGPAIVFADADLDGAADALGAGVCFNAGQTCSAPETIFVARAVADEFVARIADRVKSVRVGPPGDRDTTMGPLNNAHVIAKVERHVADACERGAELVLGGHRLPEQGSELFYAPTVLAGVPVDAVLVREETFGPVASIIPFDTEDEVLRWVDAPQFGLAGAVWTTNAAKAFHVAERLHTGIVNINDSTTYWECHLPFGGFSGTHSGIGRLGGMQVLHEMTELKTVVMDLRRW